MTQHSRPRPAGERAALRQAAGSRTASTLSDDLASRDGPADALRRAWRSARTPSAYLHLDAGAAARTSIATQRVMARHVEAEAATGAYVAEHAAADVLLGLRRDLGALLGLRAENVGLVESASTALAALLAAWPLEPGAVVACAPSEWGPNRIALADHHLQVIDLPVDDRGQVDLDGLQSLLYRAPPALVQLTVAASHRALVQPAVAVVELCRSFGTPIWCDVAQAIGQVPVHDIEADAVFGTGRKWLAGPRGVGFVGVRPDAAAVLRPSWPALRSGDWPGERGSTRRMESREAHIAGRVGLAQAVTEFLQLGPRQVHSELGAVGRRTRAALADLPGWFVLDPLDAPGALTALSPTGTITPALARSRLLIEHQIVTTAAGIERAPRDMKRQILRLTPHVDTDNADLTRLRHALEHLGRQP